MIVPQTWKQLASLQNGAICLPMIMIGHILGQTYGLLSALLAIGIGNALLLGLSLLMFHVSYQRRVTTIEQASFYFGKKGVLFLAMAMTCSMLGWFAIQLNVMSLSLVEMVGRETLSPIWIYIALGMLITGVALYGIGAISQLAKMSLPILGFTLAYALYRQEFPQMGETIPLSLKGLSLVMAAAITAVIDLPTYFRHARSSKDGWLGLIAIYGLAIPLIEAIGVYLSLGNGLGLLENGQGHGGSIWMIWVTFFLLLAGWTTNNTNLYSGVASLQLLLPHAKEWQKVACFGFIGTALSCLGLLNHFETVLDVLGLLLISMGAVILGRALFKPWLKELHPSDNFLHLQAWLGGVLVGMASLMHWIPGTAIAALDAFIATLLMTITLLIGKQVYEKVNPLRF